MHAARTFAFQTVDIRSAPGEYETMTGAGIIGDGRIVISVDGGTFPGGDRQHAGGNYDGAMSSIICRAANRYSEHSRTGVCPWRNKAGRFQTALGCGRLFPA